MMEDGIELVTVLSTGGSEGLFAQKTLEITDDILATYKNQGRQYEEETGHISFK